jgi:hypothetical protein
VRVARAKLGSVFEDSVPVQASFSESRLRFEGKKGAGILMW